MISLVNKQKKVLLIENFASDFYGARLPLAKYLIKNGWDVYAMIPEDKTYSSLIQIEGIFVIEYPFNRNNKGLFQLFNLIKKYKKIINENDFQIVHSFRFQPNLLNVLSGVGKKHQKIIHITGLGIAFSNKSYKYKIFKYISQFTFFIKFFLTNKVIFQNADDINDIWASRFFKQKIQLINGSGIDIKKFSATLYDKKMIRASMGISEDKKVFICITRLIWEKGIQELVEAFKKLHIKNKNILLYIVGWSDYDNPRHVSNDFISSITSDTGITFLGKRIDIPELLAMSDVFILPSYYREGVPRSLLEALSMGLPIITTDMPGCRITINNNLNGILIQPKSVYEIENSVNEILKKNFIEMKYESRNLVDVFFKDTIIFNNIINTYS